MGLLANIVIQNSPDKRNESRLVQPKLFIIRVIDAHFRVLFARCVLLANLKICEYARSGIIYGRNLQLFIGILLLFSSFRFQSFFVLKRCELHRMFVR